MRVGRPGWVCFRVQLCGSVDYTFDWIISAFQGIFSFEAELAGTEGLVHGLAFLFSHPGLDGVLSLLLGEPGSGEWGCQQSDRSLNHRLVLPNGKDAGWLPRS